jgi:hydroxypyruvate isomerase
MTENAAPDRISFDKNDRNLYDRLDSEEMLNHKYRTRKEQFMFAMAIGLMHEKRLSIKNRKGFFLAKDLQPEDIALLNAVAVFDQKSDEVLTVKRKVFHIAEEYAHAGIIILIEKLESSAYGTFEKHIEKEVIELFKKITFESR